ncbi:MAG: hypothetical protein LIP09_09895 [Bacteroidales bacterium]|nr:hypothetical protein [Bacteroidales bacterium]
MKKIVLIIVMAVMSMLRSQAYSYVEINVDQKTIAEMGTIFTALQEIEKKRAEADEHIRDEYKQAFEAGSTVFLSKYLLHKALTDAGLWSSDENFYYKLICQLVPNIMTKTVNLAQIMMNDPATALFWGNYIFKTTNEVQSLCNQFLSICTNSKLNFDHLSFLEVAEPFRSMVDFTQLGGVDWKERFSHFGDSISVTVSKENLKEQVRAIVDQYKTMGVDLYEEADSLFKITSHIDLTTKAGLKEMWNLTDSWKNLAHTTLYDVNMAKAACDAIMNDPAKVFNLVSLNPIDWGTDYADESLGQYYKQMWYIVPKAKPQPSAAVDSELFDSKSMDYNQFSKVMQSRLDAYNAETDSYQFYLTSKSYYEDATTEKVEGCSQAIVSVTCHDESNLGEQTTRYRCWDCGTKLGPHAKVCSMKTSLSSDDTEDLNDVESEINIRKTLISTLEEKIANIQSEMEEILEKMKQANLNGDTETAQALKSEYYEKKEVLNGYQSQLNQAKQDLDDLNAAWEEIQQENADQTDNWQRIPYLMNYLQKIWNLVWLDSGHWENYTWIRKCKIGKDGNQIEFRATVSMAEPVKKKLGIKVHRARMDINWSLGGTGDNTTVYKVIDLDPSNTESANIANANTVNQVIAKANSDYPECDVTVEYIRIEADDYTEPDHAVHLLYACDRLEVAIEVTNRLVRIYRTLVQAERAMWFKFKLAYLFNSTNSMIDWDKNKKKTLAEERRDIWLKNGKNALYKISDGSQAIPLE